MTLLDQTAKRLVITLCGVERIQDHQGIDDSPSWHLCQLSGSGIATAIFQQEWDKLAKSEDLKGTSGALLGLSGKTETAGLRITKVYSDEPAARAGVQVGDLLVTFDAERVTDMNQLIEKVGDRMPGEEITLELIRDGKKVSLKVELDMRWD